MGGIDGGMQKWGVWWLTPKSGGTQLRQKAAQSPPPFSVFLAPFLSVIKFLFQFATNI